MLHKIVRPSVFAAALAVLFIIANCTTSGSNNLSVGSNTNVANVNKNAKADTTSTGEREVSQLLDEYNDALLKKDAAALERIWADDLSFVNLRGQLLTKKERMENIKTGATSLETAKVSEKNVRVYGEAAVATLVVNIEGQYSGKEGDGSFRVTTTWAKPKGAWQMVATQMTPIVK